MVSEFGPWEWMPPPRPEDGSEDDRALQAALASRDAGRIMFAVERYLRRLDEEAIDAAPARLAHLEAVVAQWAAEGDGR